MVNKKEYFLLSILAYCNFSEKDIGKNLLEVLKNLPLNEYQWIKFKVLSKFHRDVFMEYFYKELSTWEIFSIENRRATRKEKTAKKTGFYGVSYKKNGNYVLAFRGSELAPYEEAYKDFIETNFIISMGKKPEQFRDAEEFFDKHIYYYGVKKKT